MSDEVKAMNPDPFDPERLRMGEAEQRQLHQQRSSGQMTMTRTYTPPTADEQITAAAARAQDWATGLNSLRMAVYGMDPGPRERAERVLAELILCHAARTGGRLHG